MVLGGDRPAEEPVGETATATFCVWDSGFFSSVSKDAQIAFHG